MKHSPLRVIEFCLYLLIIIAAIIYVLATGNKPTPFDSSAETTITNCHNYVTDLFRGF